MSDLTPDQLSILPRGSQMQMTGHDWTSERDRKAQDKAEAARKKAALDCAKKLEAASEALGDFMRKCNECQDGTRVRGEDDSRQILRRNILEYSTYLQGCYDK